VVISRLENAKKWKCECGQETDLAAEPYRTQLEEQRRTADEIDKQRRQRGEPIKRAYD